MIEKFKELMLTEKLDFLPLEESVKLQKSGIDVDCQFQWVISNEELPDNGFGMSLEDILECHYDLYGIDDCDYLCVGDTDKFSEFTMVLAPAPTYIDLLRISE